MGTLSGVVEDLKKELKRAQLDVQTPSAALAALGSSSSKGERTFALATVEFRHFQFKTSRGEVSLMKHTSDEFAKALLAKLHG
jgi:hypothetical protein